MSVPPAPRPLKAVVLAAGHDQATRDLLLRPLAGSVPRSARQDPQSAQPSEQAPSALTSIGSTVIEQTLANVTAVIPQSDVIVVVAEHDQAVREHLGEGWTYVVQTVQAGTGDAVRCARFQLAGFDGDVLIA